MIINIDYSHQTSFPDVLENPPLYSTMTGIGTYMQDVSKELVKLETPISGTQLIKLEYQEAVNLTSTVTGAARIRADYYTAYAEITISGSGIATIVITGNPITRVERQYERVYGRTGEILAWDNVLCTNDYSAGAITKLVGDFYTTRSIFSSNYNGHILLDPMDRILTQTDFEASMPSMLIGNTIEYNGAWRGALKWSR